MNTLTVSPSAASDGSDVWASWKCPVCGRSNDRKHEGLDACEHCRCEVATYYDSLGNNLNVKWYRPNEKGQR